MGEDKAWLLKILTGPHVGSEVVLSAGVYLLGRDENCDIILNDTSLAPKHFQLSVDNSKIVLSILAKDHPCHIDGSEADSDSIEINPYQVISTGTFCFVLGSVQDAWPPIELLGMGEKFKQAEEQKLKETTDESDEKPPPTSLLLIATAWRRLWRGPINRVYLSMGVALIGIGITLLLVVFTASDVSRGGLKIKTETINELIEEYVVDATVRTTYMDGQAMLYIHGYARTDEQRSAFMEALAKADITAQTQLYSSERLRFAVSVILDQLLNSQTDNVEVSGVSGFPGKVMLSGYVESSDIWKRVLDTIKTDVPGLQSYDDRVHTMDDAIKVLYKMLAERGLSDKVDINLVDHEIYLSSQKLSEAEQRQLATLSESFQEHFNNQPQLAYQEEGDPPINKFTPDIALQSISFGKSPYLETQDGKRYTIGAVIGDGYIIKEINRKYILLSKNGELGHYYFNTDKSSTLH